MNQMIKKSLSLLLAVALVFSLSVPALAAGAVKPRGDAYLDYTTTVTSSSGNATATITYSVDTRNNIIMNYVSAKNITSPTGRYYSITNPGVLDSQHIAANGRTAEFVVKFNARSNQDDVLAYRYETFTVSI